LKFQSAEGGGEVKSEKLKVVESAKGGSDFY
jgi:hypothetical protein